MFNFHVTLYNSLRANNEGKSKLAAFSKEAKLARVLKLSK